MTQSSTEAVHAGTTQSSTFDSTQGQTAKNDTKKGTQKGNMTTTHVKLDNTPGETREQTTDILQT